jgi:hypothetical protein
MKPQDMYIWPGMLLIGNPPRSTKGGIANGVLYTVEKMSDEFVWVRCRPEYRGDVRTWDAPVAEAAEATDLLDEELAPEPEVVLEDAGEDGEVQMPSHNEKCVGDLIRVTHKTAMEKLRLTHCLLYSNVQGDHQGPPRGADGLRPPALHAARLEYRSLASDERGVRARPQEVGRDDVPHRPPSAASFTAELH